MPDTFESINPATGELLAQFAQATGDEIHAALEAATGASRPWARTSIPERAALLRRVADELRTRQRDLATLATLEMGKPIAQAEAEVEKCAWVCDHYAEHTAAYLDTYALPDDAGGSSVRFDPLGVVLAIMPWNFPFWQVFRCAAPSLMAGNALVLKHAANVPQCALAMADLIAAAGAPQGLFQTLLVPGSAAESLILDARVQAVSFTGSDRVGSIVAEAAGRALKPAVLELGGSDPFVVLEDADVEAAARVGARARAQNNGQSCIAAKRFIAVAPVAREFEERLADELAAMRVGDPLQETTDVGPLARREFAATLRDQVGRSVEAGARVVTGDHAADDGCYFRPTVLADVEPEMAAWSEETFGPVAALRVAADEDEAIAFANDTVYGLGASIWTSRVERAHELAARVDAGSVFFNSLVASDPRRPFGGVKRSGFGRELADFGIREFTNVKTVAVGAAPSLVE